MDNVLVIFLHGVGSYGRYFTFIARRWQQQWPSARFALPDAPFPCTRGDEGYQWFDIRDEDPDHRMALIEAARTTFDAVIQREMEKHHLADRPQQVALVGFSQGAIMALDTLVSDRCRYGAIVAFSGYLPQAPKQPVTRRAPVSLVHGIEDDRLPWQRSQQTERWLTQAGVDCELHLLEGLDHRVSVAGTHLACDFLTRVMR